MRYAPKKKQNKLKPYQQLLIFSVALVVLLGSILTKLPAINQLDSASAAMTVQLPLSSRGAKIVDAQGNRVLLRGVNWFGMETESHAPGGLWKRDYKEMLAQIKSLGYNPLAMQFSL